MMSNCTELASYLSQNYRNVDPYIKTNDSLPHYLSTHGVMFTMCFEEHCTIQAWETHLAGSWINELSGVQAIETEARVGLVLDPLGTNLRCIYPTDAASSTRDDAGCGPLIQDPDFGSQGAKAYNWVTRKLAQRSIINYKNLNFGVETPWEEIDCVDFFPGVSVADFETPLGWDISSSDTEGTIQSDSILYQAFYETLQEQIDAIMGHRVCVTNEDELPPWGFLIYSGPTAWDPENWQQVMDLQKELAQSNAQDEDHSVLWYWNELVFGLPRQMQDSVTAVFYIDKPEDSEADRAHREALAKEESSVLGNKPVLRMRKEPVGDEDLFECVSFDDQSTTPTSTT